MNTDSNLIDTNSFFEVLTGYNSTTFIGKKVDSILSKIADLDDGKRIKNAITKALWGEIPPPLTLSIKRKDSKSIPTLLTVSLLNNKLSNKKRIIITLRDLTETQKYQQLAFHKDLLAHDIGNILNNIKFSAQLLDVYKQNPEKQDKVNEILEIIKQQVERGTSLISNVRKLSTMSERENTIRAVDLRKTLQESIENVCSRFRDKKLNIKTSLPPNITDVKGGVLLQDAFENILLNGCIHNESGKLKLWIEVSIVQENRDGFLKVEFKDNGIGIREGRKEAIFKRNYENGKGPDRISLGLWIVKRIIEEYGGRILVKNRIEADPTKGSNFIVYLQRA